MKVKNYMNRESFPKNYKTFTQPSETIPDQTLSIRQILDRYARGIPMDVKQPIWDENPTFEENFTDPRRMDLAEREEFAKQAKIELENIKSTINTKKAKKAKDEPKNEQREE